jgi:hypothetical protein
MRLTGFAAILMTLTVSGCATPQTRIERGLIEAGLSRKQSACMADRMADKLSVGQLLKLRSLSGMKDKDVRSMSIEKFLRNVRALRDPEILAITTRAGVGCAISG